MKKIIILLIMGMFMINLVSAVGWDNTLSYSNNDKTVLIENLFGLPLIGTELAELEITSHRDLNKPIHVGVGWQEVMTIEIDSKQDYNNAIKGIEFKNMKTNSYEELNYRWEVATYEDVDINNVPITEITAAYIGSLDII